MGLRQIAWAKASIILICLMRDFRVQSITCHLTEYKIGTVCCPLCPTGNKVKTDCTKFRNGSCLPCTNGTYMDYPNGLKSCSPCSTCDSAGLKMKKGCSSSSDTVCEPMEGFFCIDTKSGGCVVAQKHSSCLPGQYISKTGTAFTDTECSDCITGTFSYGTMLSCQPHTQCEKENLQLIKEGTASTDAECGEKSSKTTGIVVGVFLGLALIGGSVVLVIVLRWKKLISTDNHLKPQQSQRGRAKGSEEDLFIPDNHMKQQQFQRGRADGFEEDIFIPVQETLG